MPDYIFDTTVLSYLAVVGRLDLLEKRYRTVGLTTVEVSDELRRGPQAGLVEPLEEWRWLAQGFGPSLRCGSCRAPGIG